MNIIHKLFPFLFREDEPKIEVPEYPKTKYKVYYRGWNERPYKHYYSQEFNFVGNKGAWFTNKSKEFCSLEDALKFKKLLTLIDELEMGDFFGAEYFNKIEEINIDLV